MFLLDFIHLFIYHPETFCLFSARCCCKSHLQTFFTFSDILTCSQDIDGTQYQCLTPNFVLVLTCVIDSNFVLECNYVYHNGSFVKNCCSYSYLSLPSGSIQAAGMHMQHILPRLSCSCSSFSLNHIVLSWVFHGLAQSPVVPSDLVRRRPTSGLEQQSFQSTHFRLENILQILRYNELIDYSLVI